MAPYRHSSGAVPPSIPDELVPRHVAIVMDGNGRWANQWGLPRIEGHKAGEPALLDVVAGAIELASNTSACMRFPRKTGADPRRKSAS